MTLFGMAIALFAKEVGLIGVGAMVILEFISRSR
jgi:hypothetical protein